TFPLDRTVADPDRVLQAAGLIAAAKSPLIIAGGGVHISDAAADLVALAEMAAIPVATTNMGKGAIAEDHPLALGVFCNNLMRGVRAGELRDYLATADVILLAGTRTNQNGTDSWKTYPRQATYVHIDIDPNEVGRNYEALRLVGDAKLTIKALAAALASSGPTADCSQVAERTRLAARAVERYLDEVGTGSNGRVRPEYTMRMLDAELRSDDIVVADASYSSNWITSYLSSQRHGQRFLTPRGLAGLGWGMPLAIGAKIAKPGSRVVCVVGDGGFGHCWQELETARRLELPLTIILLNNAILGFQYHAENVHYAMHSDAVDFSEVDHAAIARACGCKGVRIAEPHQFRPALQDALAFDGPTLIEVMTDPEAFPPISLFDGVDRSRIVSQQMVRG
ncbi:MAG: thiamine pyrophosphate-dependent enzyme, partial [Pseudorhodoplanes sp.]